MEIVKIGAIWCPGCLVMKKIWKQIREEEEILIRSLDIDFDKEVEEYNVGETLPVIIFKKNGVEVERLIGEKKYEDIKNVIERLK